MESKVFIDTDVIIDFLIDRQPHAIAASQLFDLADKEKIILCTSVLSFNNVHYIVRKVLGEKKTRHILAELISLTDVLSVGVPHLTQAIESDFKDFEDAIQHSVARTDSKIKAIITRNTKDYKTSKIPVFNTETFIKLTKNEW